jgi:AAA+ ATPase superfamily predicted ATPase
MDFVNRTSELELLDEWWTDAAHGALGAVWGRRRVGKTELLRRFAEGRRSLFHVGARRPAADELRLLTQHAAPLLTSSFRDLQARPFSDWTDAFETLAAEARQPLLLILDEFPELLHASPELPSVLRAVWDTARTRTQLRVLLCGSAVRTMEAMREYREPLYGRFDLTLPLQPFRPHEAALMLPRLSPADRALVWGIVGGMPQYLAWWRQDQSVRQNLMRLAATPGGRLLMEGDLLMATEAGAGELTSQVLYAIASGRTKFNEIRDAVKTDPSRTLERLRELRLVERLLPVTEDERATRRRVYRIADNFLAFWLRVVSRHRSEIERELGRTIMPTMLAELDDHMGGCWEDAFRTHLRRLATDSGLGAVGDVVAVGPFWAAADEDGDQSEIDAVVLAGRTREAVLAGEAKWARRVDGARLHWELEGKARALPKVGKRLRYAVAARDEVRGGPPDLLRITARDVFG